MLLRKARLCDAGEIHSLMQPFVAQGLLLPRTPRHLCQNIRDFSVVEEASGRIVAAGALHFLDEDVAEVQSLVVQPASQGHGLGRQLVQHLLEEALEHRVWKVFALTHAPEFFHPMGFARGDLSQLPQKFMNDCLTCPKLNICHQVAVVCDVFALRAAQSGAAQQRVAC